MGMNPHNKPTFNKRKSYEAPKTDQANLTSPDNETPKSQSVQEWKHRQSSDNRRFKLYRGAIPIRVTPTL